MEFVPAAFADAVVKALSSEGLPNLFQLRSSSWKWSAGKHRDESATFKDMDLYSCCDHGWTYDLRTKGNGDEFDLDSWNVREDVLCSFDVRGGEGYSCCCDTKKPLNEAVIQRLATILRWNRRPLESFTVRSFSEDDCEVLGKIASIIPAVQHVWVKRQSALIPTILTKATVSLTIREDLPEVAFPAILKQIKNGTLPYLATSIPSSRLYKKLLRAIATNEKSGSIKYCRNLKNIVENDEKLKKNWKVKDFIPNRIVYQQYGYDVTLRYDPEELYRLML